MLKKNLSQHLIKEKNLLKKMVRLSKIDKNDTIVEIGAGQGDLTRQLCESAGYVYAVEIDRSFESYLKNLSGEFKNLHIIFDDFLKLDLEEIYRLNSNSKLKVFGNIPYRITALIIFKLIKYRNIISGAFLTVQKEFGERITALPNRRIYGSISVICQLVADIKILMKLKSTIFIPPPKVDSVFLSMQFKTHCDSINEDVIDFVRMCFEHKRKIMKNTLVRHFGADRVHDLYKRFNFSESIRAEQLEPQVFLEMYRVLYGEG